jgi:hypothetical protein
MTVAPERPDTAELNAELIRSAVAMVELGWLLVMVRIYIDPKGKKRPAGAPKSWQHLTAPTAEQIVSAVGQGMNGYLYRLPDNVFVVDTDDQAATQWVFDQLGAPDTISPRGCHWLVDGLLDPKAAEHVDSEPRQLYGPGSWYTNAAGAVVRYYRGGDQLPSPLGARHLPDHLPRKPEKSREPIAVTAPGPSGGFFDPAAMSMEQAQRAVRDQLTGIEQGPKHGAEARSGVMRAALTLGGLLHAGWFTEDEAVGWIEQSCAVCWGAADDDDATWIEQGLRDGAARPLRVRQDGPGKGGEGETSAADSPGRVVDLAAYLDGTFEEEQPTAGAPREDGRFLLYPGRWHTLIAPNTTGKTPWALHHAISVMERGELAVYAHFEESRPRGAIAWLRAMGCPIETIRERFVWLDCTRAWADGELAAVLDALERPPTLAVFDGINASSLQHGTDPSEIASVEQHRHLFVKPATAVGAAVLSLGHPPKDVTRQSERHGFGSSAWLDMPDGVGFRMEKTRHPIGKGRAGSSRVYSVKDRPGEVERHGVPHPTRPGWYELGEFLVDSTTEGSSVAVIRAPGGAQNASGEVERPESRETDCTAVLAVVKAAGGEATVRLIRAKVGGRKDRVADAIELLIADGRLSERAGPRNARLLSVAEDQELSGFFATG